LRLFPALIATFRVTVKDTEILGQRIPKGINIILAPLAVNAARNLWAPDAAKFGPDRWLIEETKIDGESSRNVAQLFPPDFASRSAELYSIGERFARAEIAVLDELLIGPSLFSYSAHPF
jgi:cytochrome P450